MIFQKSPRDPSSQALRRASGACLVTLPYDLCQLGSFATGPSVRLGVMAAQLPS